MEEDIKKLALDYHQANPRGKLQIQATKPMATQQDLALAYSPGVAAACEVIAEDPSLANEYTTRSNLVGVISNGSAVLGLGNIGALASKPVMEGKAVLFKKFAGIDVFDIEINEKDPKKLIEIVASLEPTFGGINLEDIKSPECFEIEHALKKRMNIPVFHDDQHGTAIIVAAAVTNSLRLIDRPISDIKLVCSGAGAAALACLDLLVTMGLKLENTWVCDIGGVISKEREQELHKIHLLYARDTDAKTLGDAIEGADVFLGLSAGGVLSAEMVDKMSARPVVLALANPVPEILPDQVRTVRPDAIIATGRSDYPNQVNNVLCFPYIFRGALDVGATTINDEMKIACVKAIADLTMSETPHEVYKAYGENKKFGADYIIPKPFDTRLVTRIAPAVAQAAMDSGVATRPITNMAAYKRRLSEFLFKSFLLMTPVFDQAREEPKRLVFAEGENWLVLQTVQQLVDEHIAKPILIGRPDIIKNRISKLGLRLSVEDDIELTNIDQDPRYDDYWTEYHRLLGRSGITAERAKQDVRTIPTVVAAVMLRRNEADAMICGTVGGFNEHLKHIRKIIGLEPDVRDLSTITGLILPTGTVFICDSQVTTNPTAEEMAELAVLAAHQVRDFGIEPKVAFVSHSSFGSHNDKSAKKVRKAVALLRQMNPDFEFDGEMHAGTALYPERGSRYISDMKLSAKANVLIMPNIDAAHITVNLIRHQGDVIPLGPLLVGAAKPAHIVTNSVTVRGLVNVAGLAVVSAQQQNNGN